MGFLDNDFTLNTLKALCKLYNPTITTAKKLIFETLILGNVNAFYITVIMTESCDAHYLSYLQRDVMAIVGTEVGRLFPCHFSKRSSICKQPCNSLKTAQGVTRHTKALNLKKTYIKSQR